MARKYHKPEEIVTKLRQVEVLVGQGSCAALTIFSEIASEPLLDADMGSPSGSDALSLIRAERTIPEEQKPS